MFSQTVAKIGMAGAIIAVVFLLAAALSPAAWGAFPGRDGRIALTVASGEHHEHQTIATMEPDGSDVRYLTSAGDPAWSPAWSPDGKRIVFVRAGPGYPDIYVMKGNGSGVRRLTSDPNWWDVDPSFSPDGKRVIFYRLFQGTKPLPNNGTEIIIMRLRDLRMRVLTTDGIDPAWSPNGRRIAFTAADPDRHGGIKTIRPDGTHERRLTYWSNSSYSNDYGATYTADGRTIYFEHDPWRGSPSLMKMRAFGRPVQRVQVPPEAGLLGGLVPDPEGGCLVGTGQRSSGQTALYAFGETCPTQGWIDSPGVASSWQPLPGG